MVRRSWCSTVVVIAGLTVGMAFAAAPPQLPIEQSLDASSMQWVPGFQYDGATLTVNGPDGVVYSRDFGPGEQLVYSRTDAYGSLLPDGEYNWQLSIRRSRSGAEQAALKAAEEEAGRLRAEASKLTRSAEDATTVGVVDVAADAKASGVIQAQQVVAAEQAAQKAEADVERAREQLELQNGPFVVRRSGSFEIRDGSAFTRSALADEAASDDGSEQPPPEESWTSGRDDTQPGLKGTNLITGNANIIGNLCVGPDCPSGGDAAVDLVIDDDFAALRYDDGGFGLWDLQVVSDFEIWDRQAGRRIVEIEEGAPDDSLYISPSGDIGLTERTVAEDLHITDAIPGIRLEDSDDGTYGMLRYNAGGLVLEGNTDQNIVALRGTAPEHSIYVAENGNVGLGTTNPVGEFEVASTSIQRIQLTDTTSGESSWGIWNQNPFGFLIGEGTGTSIAPVFMQITPTGDVLFPQGNVAIGTTAAPTERLTVVNGVGNASLLFDSAASANFFLDRGNTSSFSRFVFQTAGALKWSLGLTNDGSDNFTLGPFASVSYFFINQANGRVGIGTKTPGHPLQMASGAYVSTGGVWTNASSRDYKTDISELSATDAFEALSGMQPVLFRYKDTDNERHVGFIAEDVPELIATEDRKGLSSMDVVAVLTKVVQEQEASLQEQQETIRRLEARLAALEAK